MSEMPHTVLINRRLADAVHGWRWADIPALIAQGADANAMIDSETLLTRIIANIDATPETPGILDALRAAGADINGMDPNGGTPLTAALCRERPDLLQWLLQNGADPKRMMPGKASPLWLAVELDMADETDFRTRLLLAHGADPDMKISLSGRPTRSVREYLEETAGHDQAFSATGIVDLSEMAAAARKLLNLLPGKLPPRDIQKILREGAAKRNLKLAPRPVPKTKGPGA